MCLTWAHDATGPASALASPPNIKVTNMFRARTHRETAPAPGRVHAVVAPTLDKAAAATESIVRIEVSEPLCFLREDVITW